MFTKMLQRRGLIGDIPILDDGELGFATDTDQLFIGENGTNVLINPLIVGIQASAGPADADKFVKTDAFGVIDDTFLPAHHVKYTDLEAQDAIGGILVDSTSIDFTYVPGVSITASILTAGVSHSGLADLGNDDHLQYHTDARGDARYYTEIELDAGQLDNRYYTEAELDAGQLDNRYYTEAEHINTTTATAADAGKPIVTDANGIIDDTFLPAHHVKYTDEEARDAAGAMMTDTASVDFTYDDALDTITATVLAAGVSHSGLADLANDDHLQYHTDARGDIRYYQKIEHINATAGVVDTAKPVLTSAAGYLDATFLMTEDAIQTDRTVPVGYTYTHLNSDVQAGITLTVDGSFVTMNPQVQAGGSMAVSGSVTVIPNVPVNTQPQGGFNIVSVSNTDYTASIIDHVIYNGLTAARTVTIPTGTAGDRLKIMDGTGNASALTPILVDNLGGSATFDGILGPLTLTTPYEHVELVNLTGNAWSVVK
jgi:hypothetical protein